MRASRWVAGVAVVVYTPPTSAAAAAHREAPVTPPGPRLAGDRPEPTMSDRDTDFVW